MKLSMDEDCCPVIGEKALQLSVMSYDRATKTYQSDDFYVVTHESDQAIEVSFRRRENCHGKMSASFTMDDEGLNSFMECARGKGKRLQILGAASEGLNVTMQLEGVLSRQILEGQYSLTEDYALQFATAPLVDVVAGNRLGLNIGATNLGQLLEWAREAEVLDAGANPFVQASTREAIIQQIEASLRGTSLVFKREAALQ